MWPPETPPLPALTRAEGEVVDAYLRVVDLLGRINPGRRGDTYGAVRAAQALVTASAGLREALETMHRRGEQDLFPEVLRRALRTLDAERRIGLLAVPSGPAPGGDPDGDPDDGEGSGFGFGPRLDGR